MVMTVRSREGGASQFALPTFPGMLLVRAGGGGNRKPSMEDKHLCASRAAQDVNKEDIDGTLKMVNKAESRGKQCCHPGK